MTIQSLEKMCGAVVVSTVEKRLIRERRVHTARKVMATLAEGGHLLAGTADELGTLLVKRLCIRMLERQLEDVGRRRARVRERFREVSDGYQTELLVRASVNLLAKEIEIKRKLAAWRQAL